MQVFTSVAVNYLPKARVLAESVKRFHPDAGFHLLLCDALPAELREAHGPFDTITQVEELPIDNVRQWIFKHTLVELCTAVKGTFCQKLLAEHPGEPVFYLDPDIVVLGALDPLLDRLQAGDVLVTPHQTEPDSTFEGIQDNELSSLRHGAFNLGFLGVAPTAEGRRFADWWAERLRRFCWAEVENGLFTDQRWIDLTPAFFPTLQIHRDPGCNVATWNLSSRQVTGTAPYNLRVNGQPLRFFHFSGFDSGAQKHMLDKFGRHSPALYELRDWYAALCEEAGQSRLGAAAWAYACYDNGAPITPHQRYLYRHRDDVCAAFREPFAALDGGRSYRQWYLTEVAGDPLPENLGALREEAVRLRQEVGRRTQSQQSLTDLNAAILTANESILADNAQLAAAIEELTAVNQLLSRSHAELSEARQALLAVHSAETSEAHSVAEHIRALDGERTESRSRNEALSGTVSALEQYVRELERELEAIRGSRSYRAARKVSALVHGVWRCTA